MASQPRPSPLIRGLRTALGWRRPRSSRLGGPLEPCAPSLTSPTSCRPIRGTSESGIDTHGGGLCGRCPWPRTGSVTGEALGEDLGVGRGCGLCTPRSASSTEYSATVKWPLMSIGLGQRNRGVHVNLHRQLVRVSGPERSCRSWGVRSRSKFDEGPQDSSVPARRSVRCDGARARPGAGSPPRRRRSHRGRQSACPAWFTRADSRLAGWHPQAERQRRQLPAAVFTGS